MTGTHATPAERLARKLVVDGECLVWTGCCNDNGYGSMKVDGRTALTHRLAWTLEHGPVPEGQRVLHTCDNPPCCNPDHLFAGSQADNIADMKAKGRDVHRNAVKVACDAGHPFTPTNTYWWNGERHCRRCRREADRRRVR